jgi:hypothetical protein
MTNSEVNGIEEAPAPSARSRQIFTNFRDATVALMDCDDTPEGVQDAVLKMLDYFNNELGGADELIIQNIRRVMSNVFDLGDAAEEETQDLAPAHGHHQEIRAEQFTLVDEAGAEHATLRIAGGGAVLTMFDSQGRPRLRLRAGDKEATITICGERGEAGKGVLSATDEVERVTIGYDSAAQEPRVVINDGNENECVALSIDGEDGDGIVFLTNPGGDVCTCIKSTGLGVYEGDNNTLAECAAPEEVGDRSAAARAPKRAAILETPKADPEPRPQAERRIETKYEFGGFGARGAISDKAIRDLVSRIIPRDDDDAVKAFVTLIDSIAYNDDRLDRDSMAMYACDAAYQMTMAYSDMAGKFFDGATAELRSRAS